MADLNEVLKFIAGCGQGDKDQIISALNTHRRLANQQATNSLHMGARVRFTSTRGRGIIEGTVTKINRKTVKLDCGDEGNWSVSPTMLTII